MKRLIVIAAMLALALPAVALASGGSIGATPESVNPGHLVRLHGSIPLCHIGDQVTLFSHAFKGSRKDWAGVPAVFTPLRAKHRYSQLFRIHKNVKKGTYTIGGRCGGGNFGAGKLTVT